MYWRNKEIIPYRFLSTNLLLLTILCLCQAYSKTSDGNIIQHYSVRFQELKNENVHPSITTSNESDESSTSKAVIASVSAVLALIAVLILAACVHLAKSCRQVRFNTEQSKSSIGPTSNATTVKHVNKAANVQATISSMSVACDHTIDESIYTAHFIQSDIEQSKSSIGPMSNATTVKHVNGPRNFKATISSTSVACDQTLDDSTIYTNSFMSNRMHSDIEEQIVAVKSTKKEENLISENKPNFPANHADEISVGTYLDTIKKAYHDLSPQTIQKKASNASDASLSTQSSGDENSINYMSGLNGLKCIKIIRFDQEVEPSLLSVYSMDQFYPNGDEVNDLNENTRNNDEETYSSFSSIDVESFNGDIDQSVISSIQSSSSTQFSSSTKLNYTGSEGEI